MNASRPNIPVLHQDRWLMVVDKPAGLLSVPSGDGGVRTCLGELQRDHPEVVPVHRLDRETSGAMVFARSEEVEQALIDLFRERAVTKKYLAVVRGRLREDSGVIDQPIADHGKRAAVEPGGKDARTIWRAVKELGAATLVEVEPQTGRHNQIRLHFAALGHPLVGERKYARGRGDPVRFRRVALHAWKLGFAHPGIEQKLGITAPMPADLEGLIAELGD